MGYPIGLFYIARSLVDNGNEVFWLEYPEIEPTESQLRCDIIEQLQTRNISCVMCGGLAGNWSEMKYVFDASHYAAAKLNVSCPTVGGGGLFTYSAEDAMILIDSCDIGVIGEGEIIVNKVVEHLQQGNSPCELHEIRGVIFRDKFRKLVKTPAGDVIESFANMPFPLLSPEFEKWVLQNKTATVSISRSCPFACTFCTTVTQRKFRQRSIDDVIDEMKYMKEKYGVVQFSFIDELFITNRARIIDFCEKIIPLNIQFTAQTRASKVLTEDVYRLLQKAGATLFCFGVENINDDILTSMNKKTTRALYDFCFEEASKAGVSHMLSFNLLYGDPAETIETAAENLKYYFDHRDKHLMVQNGRIMLFPGSTLYNNACANGAIKDSTEYIRKGLPILNITNISESYLSALDFIILASEHLHNRHYADLISDFSILKINGKTKIRYKCSCHKDNELFESDLAPGNPVSVRDYKTCFRCKKMLGQVVNFSIAKHIGEKIVAFCEEQKGGGVLLWGLNGYVFARIASFLCNTENTVLFDSKHVVDADKLCHIEDLACMEHSLSQVFSRKVLSNLKSISELNVGAVIEFTAAKKNEIKATLEEYSDVPVYSVSDIMNWQ
jgi:radical SAM superfamily enzyme YgiQ (UPF0313 family)